MSPRGKDSQPTDDHMAPGDECVIVFYEQSSHRKVSRGRGAPNYAQGRGGASSWQSHHLVCICAVATRTGKDDQTSIKMEQSLYITDWNINKSPNMIGLPMYRKYIGVYSKLDKIKPAAARTAAFAAAVPQRLPAHDIDHNTEPGYTTEVIGYLKREIWNKYDAEVKDHKKGPEWLKTKLEKASNTSRDCWSGGEIEKAEPPRRGRTASTTRTGSSHFRWRPNRSSGIGVKAPTISKTSLSCSRVVSRASAQSLQGEVTLGPRQIESENRPYEPRHAAGRWRPVLSDEQSSGQGCVLRDLHQRTEVLLAGLNRPAVADEWPADMSFRMNPENPTNVALVDSVSNHESMLLASPRLRDFLRDQALPDLEFLKVAILDHKGRVAADDYSVINCCRVVDCVDQKNSQFEWDGLDNPSMEMERMALDPAALGEDDRMIRPRYVPGLVLYRMDLVEAIRAAKFTGVGFRRTVFGDDEKY